MRASSGVRSGGAISSSGGLASENDLLQVVEFVERGEPRLDVPQRLEPRKGGDRDVTGNEIGQAVEICLGHEVIEDVDDHEGHERWRGLGRRKESK